MFGNPDKIVNSLNCNTEWNSQQLADGARLAALIREGKSKGKLREAHKRRLADPKIKQAWCLKIQESSLRRCADPIVKARWSRTPHARRWWYAKHKPRQSWTQQG